MSFEEEWAQIKAETARTRLNSATARRDPGSGGTEGDLVVNQDDLGAIGTEAYKLHDRLRRGSDLSGQGGKRGEDTTAVAGRELKRGNFGLGDEISVMSGVWNAQVRTVLQACAHISNHLDYSKKSYAQEEEKIRASMTRRDGSPMSVSAISKHFK